MVTREDFEWWYANYKAKLAEAAEQEDDNEGRWADDGGNLTPIDNEAYRRDFPEVDEDALFREMEQEECWCFEHPSICPVCQMPDRGW